MQDGVKFIYNKEYWFISVIWNKDYINAEESINQIENIIINKLNNITDNDLKKAFLDKEKIKQIKEMGKNFSIKGKWETLIESFPFKNENIGIKYNTLGYLEFEVEYYKNDPDKKNLIEPILIQQIPIIVLNELKKYASKVRKKYLFFDVESPIYIFLTSNKMSPPDLKWSNENIEKYRKYLGKWIEIYSGHWSDYSDELYKNRVKQNLSNRLSELHFIRRNSGFIYMAPENFEQFFDSYIISNVLIPTAKIRAIVFALMAFNNSLDALFILKSFMDLNIIEKKIKDLTLLRGIIQTQMSSFYNELNYNRRQHFTKVLKHLIDEFNLNQLLNRIDNKFSIIQESMYVVYQQKNEENQKKTQRGMKVLNLLIGIGILSDIALALDSGMNALYSGNQFIFWLQIIISICLATVLMYVSLYYMKIRVVEISKKFRRTVDAIILDKDKEHIVLVKRKYPPYAGYYAFPGGFIEKGETPRQAVIREVKEETGLDVIIKRKVGLYDRIGRDPRGAVATTAFLCIVKGDFSNLKCSDESTRVEILPLKEIENTDLAFDHEDILKDALNLIS
ncbi:MAG: NUDIX domain-containing protein [Candidatus Helarchaeota archaeon]